jgi:hypothetical protein
MSASTIVPFASIVDVTVPVSADEIKVPLAGRVTLVAAVVVNVSAKFPDVVNVFAVEILPPSVIVLVPLLTPVPPYVPPMTDPFHVPDVMLPVTLVSPLTIRPFFTMNSLFVAMVHSPLLAYLLLW